MKRLFGAAKPEAAPKGPAPSLSDASGKIDTRVEELEKKINKCDEDIRRYMAGPGAAQKKQLIMQSMKRKKMYEQQLTQIVGTQFNIDALAGQQEQAELTVTAVTAMQAGHQAVKEQYAQLGGVGDIERLMDDMADFSDEIAEINDAMSASYMVPDGFDESAFEGEFAAMEEEMKMSQLAGIDTAAKPSYLPDAAAGYAAPMPAAAPAGAAAEAEPTR